MQAEKQKPLNVESIVKIVNDHVAPVESYHIGDPDKPLIYFFPDTHFEDIHRLHMRAIDHIINMYGLDLVGLEALWHEVVNQGVLEEIAAGENRDVKSLLETNLLFGYGLDERVTCTGLEDEELYKVVAPLLKINNALTEVYSSARDIEKKQGEPEAKKYLYNALIEKVKPLIDSYEHGNYLPHIPDGLTEENVVEWFGHFLDTFRSFFWQHADNPRSEKVAVLALRRCEDMGKNQIAVIYGGGHGEKMEEIWKRENVSYMKIKTFDYDKNSNLVYGLVNGGKP